MDELVGPKKEKFQLQFIPKDSSGKNMYQLLSNFALRALYPKQSKATQRWEFRKAIAVAL